MISSLQDFKLLRLRKFVEVDCITRYANRDIGVHIWVLHCYHEFFSVKYVDVEMMTAVLEISVEHIRQIVYSLLHILAKRVGQNGEGIGYTVLATAIRQFGYRVE